MKLNDNRVPVRPDHDGWIEMYSNDDSIVIQRDPNEKRNVINLEAAGGSGCEASITDVTDMVATQQVADECAATVQFVDGNGYICVKHGGTKNAQKWKFYWCAPEGDAWLEPDVPTMIGNPVRWAVLTVGDECVGCDEYVVPLWQKMP